MLSFTKSLVDATLLKTFQEVLFPAELNKSSAESTTGSSVGSLISTILVRRGAKSIEDIFFFKECDTRFLHSPFLFSDMDCAVSRICDALEEKSKILIFGDSDTDGLMATTILFRYLESRGGDVTARVPKKNEPYGLTVDAVDDFYKETGGDSGGERLIITVDNGITSFDAIERANTLGLDVIVTDHHNQKGTLPNALVIIDPAVEASTYPFGGISGAQVAYKLVTALRFSSSALYGHDICFLDIHKEVKNEKSIKFTVECLKSNNLIAKKRISLPMTTKKERLAALDKLSNFLSGCEIFVWDTTRVAQDLEDCFGKAVEFSLFDAKKEIIKTFPKLRDMDLIDLIPLSKLARYATNSTRLDAFFNIFITYAHHELYKGEEKRRNDEDLQLAALAAIADVMPLNNENRVFCKKLLTAINKRTAASAIMEIAGQNNALPPGKTLTARDVAFGVTPPINATGKMGEGDLVLSFFLETDRTKLSTYAQKILSVYTERKKLVENGFLFILPEAKKSVEKFKSASAVLSTELNTAVIGLIAGKLCEQLGVPSFVMAAPPQEDKVIGSVRTSGEIVATDFLSQFGEGFFLDYGGHDKAAGFTLDKARLDDFWDKFYKITKNITPKAKDTPIFIDAQLPLAFINERLLNVVDAFEPYGEGNPPLVFYSEGVSVRSLSVIGKSEKKHLKLILETGSIALNALFWGRGDLFSTLTGAKTVNILYSVERNYFNGSDRMQLILKGIERG